MIISLSGKIGSGKDTVTKIIQILSANPHFTNEAVIKFLKRDLYQGKWENKKWADKLKDIVCLLINCTREQLEDREFKEKELGEDWNTIRYSIVDSDDNFLFSTFYKDEVESELDYYNDYHHRTVEIIETNINLTPRLLLQLIGTDCMRNIIHPNIWVNALMSEYRAKGTGAMLETTVYDYSDCEFPQWIISDTRFPNEADAVKSKGGILVTIVRPGEESDSTHESEIALDNYKSFDWEIRNTGDLDYLVDEVRRFMEVFKIN